MASRLRSLLHKGIGALLLVTIPGPLPARQTDPEPPVQDEPEILGAAAAFDLEPTAEETIIVPAESLLFREPNARSSRLDVIDVLTELPVLERRGDWYRVRLGERQGWVQPELAIDSAPLIVTTSPSTPGIAGSVARELDRRLEIAREALGTGVTHGTLGPFDLLTDVDDVRLLGRMGEVANRLGSSYRERYGLDPLEGEAQSVALFANEASYRAYEEAVTEGTDRSTRGHAGGGLAAMFVEEQHLREATQLLVHELTHLLNRRTLGESTPSWVEEGIANDLAYSAVNRRGELRLGSLSGRRSVVSSRAGRTIIFEGPYAALNQILEDRSRRRSTPIRDLVSMSREQFLAPESRERHYVESVFFVRFLLDGGQGRYVAAFQTFLNEIAGGEEPGPDRLKELLGLEWRAIDLGLTNYLRVQAAYLAD